jgi:hypothetical protein
MDIDIKIDKESLHIEVENPYKVDVLQVTKDIHDFGGKFGVDLSPLNIENLIPRMIRGVAGCEGGCPTDAMSMVREGFGKFKLEYVEGGILTAIQTLESGKPLEVKIFPDFD